MWSLTLDDHEVGGYNLELDDKSDEEFDEDELGADDYEVD